MQSLPRLLDYPVVFMDYVLRLFLLKFSKIDISRFSRDALGAVRAIRVALQVSQMVRENGPFIMTAARKLTV
jgi:hypothetical protein